MYQSNCLARFLDSGEALVSMVDSAQIVVIDLDNCGCVYMPIVARELRHYMQAAPHLSQKLSFPHAICVSESG